MLISDDDDDEKDDDDWHCLAQGNNRIDFVGQQTANVNIRTADNRIID